MSSSYKPRAPSCFECGGELPAHPISHPLLWNFEVFVKFCSENCLNLWKNTHKLAKKHDKQRKKASMEAIPYGC